MNLDDLKSKIARFESVNDILDTELKRLDTLLREVGFKGGLDSVQKGALALYNDGICQQEES